MTPLREPTLRDLRYFGGGLLVLLSFVAWQIGTGATWAVAALVGGLAATAAPVAPARLAPVYRVWMRVFTPVGKAVTWATLAAVYFVILTPIALCMRSRLTQLLPLERKSHNR